ncbi:site-specific integrase [Methylosinus sp. PW1]|uniref:site-specific integrase n=1 Tax=Methylosinus sp. PW1 TaxID=107636 RepID=UPI000561FFF7|nr:site-specific integrase [Methylosinus sp. PW1]
MGTIVVRPKKDGSKSFMAQIMRRNGGKVHRESKTFERRQAALAWLEKREAELDAPGGIEKAAAKDPTLGEVIDTYTGESKRQMGRTKTQVLRAIKKHDIANMRCSKIKSEDIISLARSLADERSPQTVLNYLSHLGAIFAVAKPAWGYQLDREAMKDALIVAKRLGMTSRSRERDRRPTPDEIKRLLEFFSDRQKRRPVMMKMTKVIIFAMFSTRRQDEICRIEWKYYEKDAKRVMVRDMKNPGEKIGNNVWCDLPDEAIKVVESIEKTDGKIFPYTNKAITASFTRACKVLEIEDLHFHDLRHEGVSRLFETGSTIPKAASVSGHRSWSSLKRYAHLRQTGDKWAKETWLWEFV